MRFLRALPLIILSLIILLLIILSLIILSLIILPLIFPLMTLLVILLSPRPLLLPIILLLILIAVPAVRIILRKTVAGVWVLGILRQRRPAAFAETAAGFGTAIRAFHDSVPPFIKIFPVYLCIKTSSDIYKFRRKAAVPDERYNIQ